MTLTEYLQNAVTELRAGARLSFIERFYGGGRTDDDWTALADHVETMLRIYRYTPDSPSLRSVADLVAAVTGREMLQPQEDGWTPFQDDQGRTWYRRVKP